jgi:hypothetical protein
MDPGRRFPEHDAAVRKWLTARGWPVVDAFGLPYARLYGWRHDGPRGRFTLYMTEQFLASHEPAALSEFLEALDAAASLREAQRLCGAVLLDEAGVLRLRDFSRFEPEHGS